MTLSDNAITEYTNLFNNMVINEDHIDEIIQQAEKILSYKNRYQNLCNEVGTTMPWYFIGIIHSLEGNSNFNLHLHNGDSLKGRTINVPAGRPINGEPPFTWEESATDCIYYKGWKSIVHWDIPQLLFQFERNNGFGYRTRGIQSPYLWSYTNNYIKGKFVSDGEFDKNAVSKQVGAAVLIRYLTDKTLGLV